MFHSWNQAFKIIGSFSDAQTKTRPMLGTTWRMTHLKYYVFPIRWPGFVIITPSFPPFSAVFIDQRFSNCSSTTDVEFLKLLSDSFCGKSSRWLWSSAVTFAAVLLWFIDTILFNVRRSLPLSFDFRPLFLSAVFPWFVYVITLETAALDTLHVVSLLVTDAPAKHTPTICPLWKSEKSSILQYFQTNCY